MFKPENLPLSVIENDHPTTREHFPHLVRTATGHPVALFWQKDKADWFVAEANKSAAPPTLTEYVVYRHGYNGAN